MLRLIVPALLAVLGSPALAQGAVPGGHGWQGDPPPPPPAPSASVLTGALGAFLDFEARALDVSVPAATYPDALVGVGDEEDWPVLPAAAQPPGPRATQNSVRPAARTTALSRARTLRGVR